MRRDVFTNVYIYIPRKKIHKSISPLTSYISLLHVTTQIGSGSGSRSINKQFRFSVNSCSTHFGVESSFPFNVITLRRAFCHCHFTDTEGFITTVASLKRPGDEYQALTSRRCHPTLSTSLKLFLVSCCFSSDESHACFLHAIFQG